MLMLKCTCRASELHLCLGSILGYDGDARTPHTGLHSTDENQISTFPLTSDNQGKKSRQSLKQLDSRLFGILEQLPPGLAASRLIISRQCRAQV